MTLQELELQIQTLQPTDRAKVIQILMQTISTNVRSITKTPGVMGGDACLADTRLPVWMFVDLRRQGATDGDLLEAYPQLTAADLVNIWAYATAHPDEIETALAEQSAAMEEAA
jgi:uncharacterized protein (DUF433 family)